MTISIIHETKRNYQILGNEPVLLHCHHYNISLQETILLPDYIDGYMIQYQAAAETAKSLLTNTVTDASQALMQAALLFRKMGLGNLDFSKINSDGGMVSMPEYHFDLGNKRKNISNSPATFVLASGFIAGTLNFVYGKNYYVRIKTLEKPFRLECSVVNDSNSGNDFVSEDFGGGYAAANTSTFSANDDKITEFFFNNLPQENENGIIDAFGVLLTYLPASYYNKIAFRFEKEMEEAGGFEGLAEPLLIEAGHICGFNTLGRIMESSDWKSQIEPYLKTKTDWIKAIISAINAFGWGFWQITELSEDNNITFRVYNSPEASGYRQEFGISKRPKCYMINGVAAAIANLIFLGNIETNPLLNDNFYHQLFTHNRSFQCTENHCLAAGDDFCEFNISRG